jgi:hypothetical protein
MVACLKIMEGKKGWGEGGVKSLLRGPRHLYGSSVIHTHTHVRPRLVYIGRKQESCQQNNSSHPPPHQTEE